MDDVSDNHSIISARLALYRQSGVDEQCICNVFVLHLSAAIFERSVIGGEHRLQHAHLLLRVRSLCGRLLRDWTKNMAQVNFAN
jgi:hypothetical protein